MNTKLTEWKGIISSKINGNFGTLVAVVLIIIIIMFSVPSVLSVDCMYWPAMV